MSNIFINRIQWLSPTRRGRNGGATAWRGRLIGAKRTARNLRRMYVRAQSRWEVKGRIALTHCSPQKTRAAPIAGPTPFKDGSGAFLIRGIRIQLRKDITMLYTIAVVLIILWLLGLVTAYTMGGLIHVLLVIAIVVILLRVISGRSPV
jgi:hypothetical protein